MDIASSADHFDLYSNCRGYKFIGGLVLMCCMTKCSKYITAGVRARKSFTQLTLDRLHSDDGSSFEAGRHSFLSE